MRRIANVGDLLKFLHNKGVDSVVEKLLRYDKKSTSIDEEKEIKEHIDELFQSVCVDQFGNEFNLERVEKIEDKKYTLKISWTNHAKERSYLRADEIGFPPIVNEDIVNKLMEDIKNGKKIEADKVRSTEESGKKILVGNFEYVIDIRNVAVMNNEIFVFVDVVTVINKKAKIDYRNFNDEDYKKLYEGKKRKFTLEELKEHIRIRDM